MTLPTHLKAPPEILVSEFSRFVAARTGLDFSAKERWPDLLRAVQSTGAELGKKDAETTMRYFLNGTPNSALLKRDMEILIKRLTVGETYFFRDPKAFEALERYVLPELIDQRRDKKRLRIWSAACCTGEEPYSLAIVLNRMLPDIADWRITIVATDINTEFLRKAERGVYREWSLRNASPELRKRYFTKTASGEFAILEKYKKMVRFGYLNLAENDYPSLATDTNAMDLILCRNVLIYFPVKQSKKVVERLQRSMVDDAWLLTSATEASQSLLAPLTPVTFPGVIAYRKVAEPSSSTTKPANISPAASLESRHQFIAHKTVPALSANNLTQSKSEPQKAVRHLLKEANAAYRKGLYLEASELYERHLAASSSDTATMTMLARSKANEGKLSEALRWCEKAIALDKLDPSFHHLRGSILQEQEKADEAIASFRGALYLEPDYVLSHFSLGTLMRKQGRTREASTYFDNALRILHKHRANDVLADASGLTAGRLAEIISSIKELSSQAHE